MMTITQQVTPKLIPVTNTYRAVAPIQQTKDILEVRAWKVGKDKKRVHPKGIDYIYTLVSIGCITF